RRSRSRWSWANAERSRKPPGGTAIRLSPAPYLDASGPDRRVRPRPCSILRRPHVAAEQQLLIAQVELAIRHHGMRPNPHRRRPLARLFRNREPPFLLVPLRRRLEQCHDPVVFRVAIQVAIGTGYGAFAELALFLPDEGAFLLAKLLTDPASLIRVAVQVLAHQHDASHLVLDVLVGIDFLGRKLAALSFDLEQVRPRPETIRDEEVAVVNDRRANDEVIVGPRIGPEQLAVLGRDTGHTLLGHLDVLPHAADIGGDDRR